MFKTLQNFYNEHERYLSAGALLAGFVIDNLTLTRIDLLLDNLILFSYLMLAGFGILIMYIRRHSRALNLIPEKIASWFTVIIQFAFGGLFSGYFIFYFQSAALSASWLFMLLLALLLISNERFRTYYLNLTFQISVFFVALFSFAIFYVPILVGKIGALVFIISGVVSIALIRLFILLLKRVNADGIRERKVSLCASIAAIFIIINALYFMNIIPPIPLSLKDAEVAHEVERIGEGQYRVVWEEKLWYDITRFFVQTFTQKESEPVFFFSAVFAPTDLTARITHRWQYFNEVEGEWMITDELGFPIEGGRDGGYRGYSTKENIFPGRWRVEVVTERGQLLGRRTFTVLRDFEPPQLKSAIR